jgi:hypothetical protein
MNPARIEFSKFQSKCRNNTACASYADGISAKYPEGNATMNFGITHYFGRAQGIDGRIKSDGTANNTAAGYARVNFEVFCGKDGNTTCDDVQKALLPVGINTPAGEGTGWYKNRDHSLSNDGVADTNGVIDRNSTAGNVSVSTSTAVTGTGISIGGTEVGFQRFGATYDGNKGYPYRVIMHNDPSHWLIYNSSNENAVRNDFALEFYKPSQWVGESKATESTDSDGSVNTSRRIMW